MPGANEPQLGALRLSTRKYFIWVAAVTGAILFVAALSDPVGASAIKTLVGLEETPHATVNSFNTARVAPLFDARCVSCHGGQRQKGRLRLDSFTAVRRGGRHGAAIQPGNVDASELFSRISLPHTDERAMPPDGKTRLDADEITVIKLWIEKGASGSLRVDEFKEAPKLPVSVVFPEYDFDEVERERAPHVRLVEQLKKMYPSAIQFESRGSADVEINASLLGLKFGDGDVVALAPLSERIVRADFSGTAISDASVDAIAKMRRLRVLRLASTQITDVTVRKLALLEGLQSLTVVATGATDDSLIPIIENGTKVYAGVDDLRVAEERAQ
jgi:hypothetical protein